MRTVSRTVRVPLVRPDDETWEHLRAIACKAARFGNLALADTYAALVNGISGEGLKKIQRAAFKRMNDELSGWVRGAMTQNRVKPYWTRSGKDVLAGRERLACFSGDRALIISADQRSNPGALYEWDGEDPILVCRFEPVQIRDEDGQFLGNRDPTVLKVAINSTAAKKDWHIREAIESIWAGSWLPGTVTIRFNRRKRKVDAVISYTRPAPPELGDGTGASLGPFIPETGELWLRFDEEGIRPLNFAHRINHMRQIKENHEGLTHRLRRKMGRAKGRRQVYRRKLEEIGNYSTWARGRMHELSREIVKALQVRGAVSLRVQQLGEGDLPWHTLKSDLKYKCEDAGIRIEIPDVKQDATARAKKAEIQKRTRRLKKAKTGVAATRELIAAEL